MIKQLSKSIANLLGQSIQSDEDKINILAYGVEIILGIILKLTLILLLSCILGILKATIPCLISFIIFRTLGGGIHLSTYSRCLSVGVIMFLVLGKVSTVNLSITTLKISIFIISLFGIYTIVRFVPAGTEKKKITDTDARLKQKKKTIYALLIWILTVLLLINYQVLDYVLATVLGTVCSFFFMTSWGYWVIHTLDNVLDSLKINKRGGMENV